METLESTAMTDDRSAQKPKISFPGEIIEEILSRLPVKSILRFKSVSKPWLSLISNSSFTKLHSTVGPRTTALYLSAYDSSTGTRYFFSNGGSVMKLHKTPKVYGPAEHLNGLVCFTSRDGLLGKIYAFVFNPSTQKYFKLPDPVSLPNYISETNHTCYLFGFDESSNEHKILYIDVGLIKPTTIEVMIFSFSNYSWRKVNVDLPIGMSANRWYYSTGLSVCVNSAIHLMLRNPLEILVFDLRTDKFSIVSVPLDAVPRDILHSMCPYAYFIKINGLLGVACHDPWNAEDTYKVHVWILQDYGKGVWVRETVTLPSKFRIGMGATGLYPMDSVNVDELIFYPRMLSEDLISVHIYNMKTRCFKSIQLTLGHRFLTPASVQVEHLKFYVESLIPLPN